MGAISTIYCGQSAQAVMIVKGGAVPRAALGAICLRGSRRETGYAQRRFSGWPAASHINRSRPRGRREERRADDARRARNLVDERAKACRDLRAVEFRRGARNL